VQEGICLYRKVDMSHLSVGSLEEEFLSGLGGDAVLDADGAASRLKVTRRHLRKLAIPCRKVSKNVTLYRVEDLDSFLKGK
jgi:hypothetical protein